MRRRAALALAVSFGIGLSGAARAADAPPVPTGLPATQPVPAARPYADPDPNADAAVAAAMARAKADHKLVLIDLGANWCPDCRMLSGVMAMPQVSPWIDGRFERVMVNVDRLNRNMDIPKRFGVTVKQIPTVLVVTPDGKLLNPDGTLTLGDARTMSPQADVDLLASWAARAS